MDQLCHPRRPARPGAWLHHLARRRRDPGSHRPRTRPRPRTDLHRQVRPATPRPTAGIPTPSPLPPVGPHSARTVPTGCVARPPGRHATTAGRPVRCRGARPRAALRRSPDAGTAVADHHDQPDAELDHAKQRLKGHIPGWRIRGQDPGELQHGCRHPQHAEQERDQDQPERPAPPPHHPYCEEPDEARQARQDGELHHTMICGQSEGLVEHLGRRDKDHQQAHPDHKEEAEHKRLCPIHRHEREAIKHPTGFWVVRARPTREWRNEPIERSGPQPSWEQVGHSPIRRSARDDLDIGQPEPRSTVATDDSKAMGGQQAAEIGRHGGVEMAQPWKGRAAASLVRENVGKDEHPTRNEHAADLGDPGRWVRPVPQGQGGEHEVEHIMGERQVLGAGAEIADSPAGWG